MSDQIQTVLFCQKMPQGIKNQGREALYHLTDL